MRVRVGVRVRARVGVRVARMRGHVAREHAEVHAHACLGVGVG